eukprot:10624842-Alexandrium_andersonii.AAC.1
MVDLSVEVFLPSLSLSHPVGRNTGAFVVHSSAVRCNTFFPTTTMYPTLSCAARRANGAALAVHATVVAQRRQSWSCTSCAGWL